MVIGVVGGQNLLGDFAGGGPAHILGHGRVPQIVVVIVLHDVAAGVGLQRHAGGLETVVEAGGNLVVLLGHAGLLLDEAGQDHRIVQRVDAVVRVGVHLGLEPLGLLGELVVEGADIVLDGVIGEELVGLGEEVALALEQAAGIVRHLGPEGVVAEIRLHLAAAVALGVGLLVVDLPVGAGQEILHRAKAVVLHQLGDGHRRGAFWEGDGDRLAEDTLLGDGVDDVIVGHAGAQLHRAGLQITCLAAVAGIDAEQPAVLDDAGIRQLLGNGGGGGAVLNLQGDGIPQNTVGAAAVNLGVKLHGFPARNGDEHHHDEHDHNADGEPAAGLFLLLILVDFLLRLLLGLGGRLGLHLRSCMVCVTVGIVFGVVALDPHKYTLLFRPVGQTSRRKYTSVSGKGFCKKRSIP